MRYPLRRIVRTVHISSKMIRKVLSYTSRLRSWVVALSEVLNRKVVELFGAVVARLFPPSMTVLLPGDQMLSMF